MKINGKEITLYDKDGKIIQNIDEFLEIYNEQYYSTNNKDVEDKIKEILENGMQSKEDLFRVLAWVYIRINMKKSEKNAFVYYEGMDEESLWLRLYSKNDIMDKSDINDLYKEIEKHIGNCDNDEKAQNFLIKIRDYTSKKDWGKYFYSVYMITLLCFVSKGKYPIVNSSSYMALEAIYRPINFGERKYYPGLPSRDTTNFEKIITQGKYAKYRERLENFSKLAGETDLREVDQALWVYGKLFKK